MMTVELTRGPDPPIDVTLCSPTDDLAVRHWFSGAAIASTVQSESGNGAWHRTVLPHWAMSMPTGFASVRIGAWPRDAGTEVVAFGMRDAR